ncbi:hypothetical protein C883_3360 [Bacillus stratosphericus LAMA 585]|nr:hypothetical protein C883_3360 [Bacillus stratosphericus LAMA 585]
MNKGFEELVNDTRRSASILVSCPSCRSLVVNLAPEGKPEAIPIASTNPPTPGTRKIGRINGSNNTPTNLTIPKLINSSDKIKKGSSDGKTTSHHIASPFFDACKEACGCVITVAVKKIKKAAMNRVFHFFMEMSPLAVIIYWRARD